MPTQKPFHMWRMSDTLKYLKKCMAIMKFMEKYGKITISEFADSFNGNMLKFAFNDTLMSGGFSMFALVNTLSGLSDFNSGIPLGGSQAFANRMRDKFLSLGGKLNLNADVAEIIVDEGKAQGTRLGCGETVPADYVVPACDVHHTEKVLLKGNYGIEKIDKMDADKEGYPTYSVILISYCTESDLSALPCTSIFACSSYEVLGKNFDAVTVDRFGYDKSLSSDGKTVAQIAVSTDEQGYESLVAMDKDEYEKELADKMRDIPASASGGIFGELEIVDVATPITLNRYVNAYKGAFMAYMMTNKNSQAMLMNNLLPIDNVVLAGQWLMMPGGTPVAAVEGKFAAMTIVDKEKKKLENAAK